MPKQFKGLARLHTLRTCLERCEDIETNDDAYFTLRYKYGMTFVDKDNLKLFGEIIDIVPVDDYFMKDAYAIHKSPSKVVFIPEWFVDFKDAVRDTTNISPKVEGGKE
jgi:hypothetical protein